MFITRKEKHSINGIHRAKPELKVRLLMFESLLEGLMINSIQRTP